MAVLLVVLWADETAVKMVSRKAALMVDV